MNDALILKGQIVNHNGNNLPQSKRHLKFLSNHGWEMLHNEPIYSNIYGEMELYNGYSYFYDGKNVTINGFRLNKAKARISDILERFAKDFLESHQNNIETFNYWGIEEPKESIHPMLKCVEKEQPNEFNLDVVLELKKLSLKTLYNYRFVRRAFKKGLTCRINYSKEINLRHLDIVKIFRDAHVNCDDDGQKYIDNWINVLNDKDSLLFEIYRDHKMTGFLILNNFFKHMPTYAYGFYDNKENGTSDLAYAAMIEYCKACNYPLLDLGYSVKESLLRYKKKWGPVILREAPWYISWKYQM